MPIEQLERAPLSTADGVPNDAAVLSRLLASRYSCRAYKPEPVPHDLIEQMLLIAQNTASWCNSQPWQTIVTEVAGHADVAMPTAPERRGVGIFRPFVNDRRRVQMNVGTQQLDEQRHSRRIRNEREECFLFQQATT